MYACALSPCDLCVCCVQLFIFTHMYPFVDVVVIGCVWCDVDREVKKKGERSFGFFFVLFGETKTPKKTVSFLSRVTSHFYNTHFACMAEILENLVHLL